MIALFSLFQRCPHGWSKYKTPEGISLLFPNNPVRKPSKSESPLGKMNVVSYSAGFPGSTSSAILSIRDFEAYYAASAADYFADWRAEFQRTMEICHVDIHLIKEEIQHGVVSRCDLLFSDSTESVYTRVSLFSQGTRLAILFAVGKLQEISGAACSESFHSVRI